MWYCSQLAVAIESPEGYRNTTLVHTSPELSPLNFKSKFFDSEFRVGTMNGVGQLLLYTPEKVGSCDQGFVADTRFMDVVVGHPEYVASQIELTEV